MADESVNPNPLAVTSTEQYRTAGELIERSRPNVTYFILLAISSLIIAAGLLLNNSAIVIGGMLVAPVLTPLLAIGLGLAIGEVSLMKETSVLLIKSIIIVIVLSAVMAILFGVGQTAFNIENDVRAAILYFIVALASGVAATFAWTRKEISEVLPGIAIAVSLVPPLSLVGIWLATLHLDASRFYFSIFLLNLFGIIIGSLGVFSLQKFYKSSQKIHKKVLAETNVPPAEK